MNESLINEQESSAEELAASTAPSDPIEEAMAAAQAEIEAASSDESSATDEQAAGDTGASIQEEGATEGGDAADGEGEGDATQETEQGEAELKAPADWPQDWQDKFASLPAAGQKTVLEMNGDLQAGFTKAMQDLSDVRRENAELFDAMDTANASASDVASLLKTAVEFESDPKGTLRLLAGRKNIDLYFEPPAPAGAIPEFDSQADLVRWVQEQNEASLDARLAAREAEHAEKLKANEAKAKLQNELSEAEKLPGFAQARNSVMLRLGQTPGLSVEDAYRLERFPALEAEASKAGALAAENAELKATIEANAKKATAPPSNEGLESGEAPSSGDPVVDAMSAARKRIQAGHA